VPEFNFTILLSKTLFYLVKQLLRKIAAGVFSSRLLVLRSSMAVYPKNAFPARRDRMLRRFSNTAAPNSPRHSIRSRPSGFFIN